jgi:thiol-disulfide isomerase/thioredoxin
MRKKLVNVALMAGLGLLPILLACGRVGQTVQGSVSGGAGAVPAEFNKPLTALDGTQTSLAKYQGKVVLVNFWATWCDPCHVEIPWLIEFQRKYGSKGLVIVGVAMDEEGKSVVRPWVDKQRFDVNGTQEAMNYPIVLGNDALAEQFGGLIGMPTSMLYSRDGKKVKTMIGLVNQQDLTKMIESLL